MSIEKDGNSVTTQVISESRTPWYRRLRRQTARCFAVLVGMLPRRHRYQAVRRFCAVFGPLLSTLPEVRCWEAFGLETSREISLGIMIGLLDGAGVQYDLPFLSTGLEALERAADSGRGVLLVGVHSLVTHLIPRLLLDSRVEACYVRGAPTFTFPGTSTPHSAIVPGPLLFLQIAHAFEQRQTVWALVDRPEAIPGRTAAFETSFGTVHLSTPFLQVARMYDAKVFFMMTAIRHDGAILVSFVDSGSEPDTPWRDTLASFDTALRMHVGTVHARPRLA